MAPGIVARPGDEVVGSLARCLERLRLLVARSLEEGELRREYEEVAKRVLRVLSGSVDLGFTILSGFICVKEEKGVTIIPALYVGEGRGGEVNEHLILLPLYIFDADQRVLCRSVLHELVHVAGYDEDVANEFTEVLSELHSEVLGDADLSAKATRDAVEKAGVPTCLFVEEAIEKDVNVLQVLRRYAIKPRLRDSA